jgi:predicted PurR-regulated permease PerM
MTPARQAISWLSGFAVFVALLWLLGDVLVPFVAGMVIAYLLDPLADRLEAIGLSRTLATTLLTVLFIVLILGGILLLVPVVEGQVRSLSASLPEMIERGWGWLGPWIEDLRDRFDLATEAELQEALKTYAGNLGEWATGLLGGLASGGAVILNIVSLLVITPVVSFYLLRDWNNLVHTVDGWLPRDHRDTIRRLLGEIDHSIAGFLRGQMSVCVLLGLFYGLGLAALGLNGGLVVGLLAGLISFIPYVGSITGFIASIVLAGVQYGLTAWLMLGLTAGLFAIGQFIEGNFLTPRLVGSRVGLHPVWVIFALLAGGSLFGFLGVMLAVPVAAAIGVLTRFALSQYLASALYAGRQAKRGPE